MSSATMERIVTQRIANATKAINHANYEILVSTKLLMDPKVKAKDGINASTWNLVDRSLTSAKIRPLSGIIPSTIDTKYSVELAGRKIKRYNDAEGECSSLQPSTTGRSQEELYHTRPRAWYSSVYPEDVETLSVRRVPHLGEATSFVCHEEKGVKFDVWGDKKESCIPDKANVGGMMPEVKEKKKAATSSSLRYVESVSLEGVIRFGKTGKAGPLVILDLFKIICQSRITVAYRLDFQES
ncbi:hypothetical protein Tco_0714620 [Tanacetum coccineum]